MTGKLALLFLPAALVPALALAQSTPEPTRPAGPPAEVVVDGYAWTQVPGQAVSAYVSGRDQGIDTAYLTLVIVVAQPDGSLTALTPCNDLDVRCTPITVEASGALATTEVPDALVLRPAAPDLASAP